MVVDLGWIMFIDFIPQPAQFCLGRWELGRIGCASGAVSHQNGFRAEYSGRNLAEYSAETVSVKIMSFGDERNIR